MIDSDFYKIITEFTHPSIQRGQVWCRTCGSSKKVDPAYCLQHGWPKCCGYTMTIDSPEEQEKSSQASPAPEAGNEG